MAGNPDESSALDLPVASPILAIQTAGSGLAAEPAAASALAADAKRRRAARNLLEYVNETIQYAMEGDNRWLRGRMEQVAIYGETYDLGEAARLARYGIMLGSGDMGVDQEKASLLEALSKIKRYLAPLVAPGGRAPDGL